MEYQGKSFWSIYVEMMREGIFPNELTYACILNACATIGAIDTEKQHKEIARHGLLQKHIVMGNALVEMYQVQ